MRVIVLGSSGSYPGPGKACAGFLVVEGETRLLLDCGTGVLANFQVHAGLGDLNGIIISHMHPDHFLDLVPMRYALAYSSNPLQKTLPVYFPPGGREIWERMVAGFDESRDSFSAPFELVEYQEGRNYQLGVLSVCFTPLPHYAPNFGIEVRASRKLAYSGDTRQCPELINLARQADLFICEATLLEDKVPLYQRGHLTAREAGEVAREAEVRQMLLTHIFPGVDAERILDVARAAFGAEVYLAKEGQSYTVGLE